MLEIHISTNATSVEWHFHRGDHQEHQEHFAPAFTTLQNPGHERVFKLTIECILLNSKETLILQYESVTIIILGSFIQ